MPGLQDAFFRQVADDAFEASASTRGPWDPRYQHAGPPSALAAGRLEALLGPSYRVVRVSVEVTRPVPIGRLALKTSRQRDGRTVKTARAEIADPQGTIVMTIEVLALATAEVGIEPTRPSMNEGGPDEAKEIPFPFFDDEQSYATATDLRFSRGRFGDGDVMAWMRMRVALIEGAQPSALERVMVVADSGNGVSQRLDTREFTFVNPDLTVTLHDMPEGEWIGLASRTDLDPQGIGLADTRLYDTRGAIGRGIQTLVVRKRAEV